MELDLRAGRQQAVLAVLALEIDRPVSAESLVEAVWGEWPPRNASNALHSTISRLRRVLAPAVGRRDPAAMPVRTTAGYLLPGAPEQVDALCFEAHLADARRHHRAGDHIAAEHAAVAALGLWRGQPFTGLDSPYFHAQRERWRQNRLLALELRAEAAINHGRDAETVAELTGLVAEHPLRERLRELLMLALYRSGRQAEALELYQQTRSELITQLGVEPGPALRILHERILSADATLTAPARPAVRPSQLPLPVRGFTGRERELAELTALARRGGVVAVVCGPGGIGKTSLVLQWAQVHLQEFPDGQLYVDLRGYSPLVPPLPASAAAAGFLAALGVPPSALPPREQDQAALLRSLLTQRRMLLVLDNARDSDQVAPLLPGTAHCTVLITSRHRLDGLLATSGAQPLVLEVFTQTEAREFLALHAGADRARVEPEALDAVIARCARLPLALAIVAARAATHPQFSLAALAEELREDADRLDVLDTGEITTSLRAVVAATYQTLSAEAARLAGLLALAPGPDIGLPAAAVLADLPPRATRQVLVQLTRVHLAQEHRPSRYRMHDLVRLYAAERASTDHPPADLAAVLRQLCEHYLREVTAKTATAQALSWMDTERSTLIAAAEMAISRGWSPPAAGLAIAIQQYLDDRGHYEQALALGRQALTLVESTVDAPVLTLLALTLWRQGNFAGSIPVYHRALRAAHDTADHRSLGRAHNGLGFAHWRLGDLPQALACFEAGLEVGRRIGNHSIQAYARTGIGYLAHWRRQHRSGLAHHEEAVLLARLAGDQEVECHALNGIGLGALALGRVEQALEYWQRALHLARDSGSPFSEARALVGLGWGHQRQGELDTAMRYHHAGLVVAETIGDRYQQARACASLADIHTTRGEREAARQCRMQAQEHAEAAGVSVVEVELRWIAGVAPEISTRRE
ncbi:tetratricopeptide repeat protein [Crossiella sp. SN42]|uniref:AfsR/SARP family transcriptional regulator n=1 Tax=Crossiella sp. SN42 TaxID=2944808 RepID=UPI00207D231B|nr:BTAD domain-containing putative transcriptional regulator [Crossiella sp. SN42]MCO1575151.1 tetratricopeptide repeat protein [Crossiella sp. SN42]